MWFIMLIHNARSASVQMQICMFNWNAASPKKNIQFSGLFWKLQQIFFSDIGLWKDQLRGSLWWNCFVVSQQTCFGHADSSRPHVKPQQLDIYLSVSSTSMEMDFSNKNSWNWVSHQHCHQLYGMHWLGFYGPIPVIFWSNVKTFLVIF